MYASFQVMDADPNKEQGETSFLMMADIKDEHGKIDSSPLFMDDFWADSSYKPASQTEVDKARLNQLQMQQLLAPSSMKFHDSGKPRLPKSAFEVFVQYEKSSLQEKFIGEGKDVQENDPAVMKILKEQWKGMQSWQKDVYKQLAEGDRKRYKDELRQWNATSCQRSRGQVGEYLRSVLVTPSVPNLELPQISRPASNVSIPPTRMGKRAASFALDDTMTTSAKVARFSHQTAPLVSDWDSFTSLLDAAACHLVKK